MPDSPFEFTPADYTTQPGVYLMKDVKGRILYVGKAKSLRKRLSSYFRSGAVLTAKTRVLVSKVASIDTLVTATEKEALLLEESLIKKHRPRYNVILRDDKQYVLFKLTRRHEWPRLTVTRKVTRDGSAYFGPFTSAASARETWRVIGRVFQLRKCSDHVLNNRVRPCLYHYIGQCLGPCVLPVDRNEYATLVNRVEMLLSGRSKDLTIQLTREMQAASEALEFEHAAALRDQIKAIQQTVERQTVVLPEAKDVDVLDLAPQAGGLAAGLIFIRQGRLLGQKAFAFPGMAPEDGPEVVASLLVQFYGQSKDIPPRILVPYAVEDNAVAQVLSDRRGSPVRLAEPHSGDEKALSELARRNARSALERTASTSITELLQRALRLRCEPERIECVDVSHLGGTGVRVGQVVFHNGQPMKDAYRVYRLAEAEGTSDDYLALATWAKRRLESGPPWPDLVLIDGGKGQLSAVERALAEAGLPDVLDGCDGFELASIAKGETRAAGELGDSIFRPGRKNPLNLKQGGPELLFLQRMRDAAHNFVIGRQRKSRAKQVLSSELTRLPGIGPKTARLLWDRFDSLDAMRAASVDELAGIPGLGKKKAEKIAEALAGLG